MTTDGHWKVSFDRETRITTWTSPTGHVHSTRPDPIDPAAALRGLVDHTSPPGETGPEWMCSNDEDIGDDESGPDTRDHEPDDNPAPF